MVYLAEHTYLTVHWSPTGVLAEAGQFGIRFGTSGEATQAQLDACAAAVSQAWSDTNMRISAGYTLESIKIARINREGLYPDGHVPLIHIYPGGVAGGIAGTTFARFPLQCSNVVSLTTAAPRGRAHRGRIYLPPVADELEASHLWPVANCQQRATRAASMINNLNSHLGGAAAVMSRIGPTGTTRTITGVLVGNRPDVQRRRAKSQVENYSSAAV